MQVEIKIDPSCREPKVVIMADSMTEEVQALLKKLSAETPRLLTGCRDEKMEVLDPCAILRVYAGGGKVFAVTEQGEYTLRQRLYEAEALLKPHRFVRISHSELICLTHVQYFDLNLAGTICVKLSDGTVTYVSRRYVPKLKKILGI